MQRVPTESSDLANTLSGELRVGELHQDIRTRRLAIGDLIIDCRLGQLMADFLYDHARGLVDEALFETSQKILAEVVVDILNRDLGIRILLQNIFPKRGALRGIDGIEGNDPGKRLGIVEAFGA